MIDSILRGVKMLLTLTPFLLLCLAGKKVNLPKANRSKQVVMPIITLIYTGTAMLLVNSITEWIIALIERLVDWFHSLAALSWMPGIIGSLLNRLGNALDAFLSGANLPFWLLALANTAIVLGYLAVKRISIAILSKAVKTDGDLFLHAAGIFYEYFPERDVWCIRENYIQVRGAFMVFYYFSVIVSAILTLLSGRFYREELLSAMFYPVFGILIVGELYFFLDGLTKKEYANRILGEEDAAYKTVNYSLLRKFLRSVFGDKLLAENTGINNALSYDVTTDEVLRELEKIEDHKTACFTSFFESKHRAGMQIDHNFLRSSLDMLHGKSVLFNDPFYNDLIPYAFYPMNRALLSHRKVLVVLGRHAIEEDIRDWLMRGVESVTNIPFLWNIGVLGPQQQDLDIGIVTRSDVLNTELHNANADFLEKVSFCVIIEPSKLVSTAQIGLNLLVKKCAAEAGQKPVFCMCDKNCDGLVDAMSHILMANITEVSATEKHLGTSSYMCRETDSDYLHHRLVPNISRYLGLGTELSFAALRNQVSKTRWFGGEAFPVTDMRWIDRQYYYDLTKYAGIPTNQESMDERFVTTANFWSAEVEKNGYLTVEDEAFNMFEILRDFATRTTQQGFINVISPDYLLRDYMAENASIFEADAKAIPYISADHSGSSHNTTLRLLLMLSMAPVCSEVLEEELSLLGVSVFDLEKQLWYEIFLCFSPVSVTAQLPQEYRRAVEAAYALPLEQGWDHSILEAEEQFDLKDGRMKVFYSVKNRDFMAQCVWDLRSAGYIAEDGKGNRNYLGSELSGHIYQRYLPGQFFTFGGKYYEMLYLTADNQVLVRRAADHITGRPSYRQMREYVISGIRASDRIGARQDVAGMKIVWEYADISVSTPGYYRMEKYGDFATAKPVLFDGEKNGIPVRTYRNKEILRIELPEQDGRLTDDIRRTVTLLLNEIFRTLFAENQAYICALTDAAPAGEAGRISPMTYTLRAEGCATERSAIYIVEDSQLDLGLTIAVERNLDRILGIMHDYLAWHIETLENSLNPPPDPQPHIVFTDGEDEESVSGEEKGANAPAKSWFRRLIEKIKSWFRKKPPKQPVPTDGDAPAEDVPEKTPPAPTDGEKTPPPQTSADTNETSADPEGSTQEPVGAVNAPFEDTVTCVTGNEQAAKAGFSANRRPYHQRYYLLFGGDCEPAEIDPVETLDYLAALGLRHNALKQARDGRKIAEFVEATFRPGKPDARYCDFCGAEIYGVEYETLADGRDRCIHCSRTAIKTAEEFRKLFEDVKRNMESFFGIRIHAGIRVEMVNSKTLHSRLGESFIPTPKSDGRVLGVAIKDKNGYTLMVENGSPRMASMLTMAHELTHIWQYLHWDDKAIRKKYGNELRLEIYEGMAKWVEVQYAYLINEPATAKREEIITAHRDDAYGRGFLRYMANYPFSTGTVITRDTPFMDPSTPLAPEYCGSFRVRMPTDGINPGDREGDTPPETRAQPTPVSDPISGPIQRDPSALTRYAYNLLNEEEQRVYTVILDAINDFRPEISEFGAPISDATAQKLTDYVLRDHPEIFWFRGGATYYYDKSTRLATRIVVPYCMTREEAEKRRKRIDAAIKSFMPPVTDTMSDYEVTLRIYDNIVKLVDYDSAGLERQEQEKPGAETPDDLRSIFGVFVNRRAVCAGYAKAMQYLLNLCGIECTYVTSETHAWNLLKLEGDYYHLDVTWGDGSNTKKDRPQNDAIGYDCFCITTRELERLDGHKPLSGFPLPECTATRCNYHRRFGSYFETFDLARARRIVCQSAERGRLDISFRFASLPVLQEAKKQLVEGGKFREIIQYANLKSGARLSLSYMYSSAEDRLTMAFYLKKS